MTRIMRIQFNWEKKYTCQPKEKKYFKFIRFNSSSSSDKCVPMYLGPFKIIRKVYSHAYEVDLPVSMRMHPVVHIRYLKEPKIALIFPGRIVDNRKPPEVVDNSLEYDVEAVLKQRVRTYGKGYRKTVNPI